MLLKTLTTFAKTSMTFAVTLMTFSLFTTLCNEHSAMKLPTFATTNSYSIFQD